MGRNDAAHRKLYVFTDERTEARSPSLLVEAEIQCDGSSGLNQVSLLVIIAHQTVAKRCGAPTKVAPLLGGALSTNCHLESQSDMETNKPKAVFISSLVFLVVTCVFYLRTYLPRNTEDNRLHQLESDLNAVAVPQTDVTGIAPLSYSPDDTSEISEKGGDHISSKPNPVDDPNNQTSESLTDIDTSSLISEMEKQRNELLQAYEEKEELALLAQDELFAHCDAFQIEFEASLTRHNAIQEKFEREVLGGRSVDEVVRSMPREELEKLRSRPESQPLIEACFRHEKLCADYEAQSKALANRANELSAQAGKLSIQALEIDNSIADLKSMLE